MAGSLLLSGAAIGQSSQGKLNKAPSAKKHSMFEAVKTGKKQTNTVQEKGALIWEDDFSDPNTWVMTNTSQPTSVDWVIQTDPSDVPNAAPELQPFNSSTASNGYALIDSDRQPNNADGDGAIVAEITTASAIDCSGSSNVILTFEHSYRWWQDTRGVRVSGDNGANWTEFEITNNAGYPNDQNSENPKVEQIDISAVAGGSNQVLVQFYYNDNDYWAWYWTVDDVRINEADQYDLVDEGIYWGAAGNIGVRVPYYQVPLDQVTSYDISGIVRNFGYENQTDVVYTAAVVSEAFTSSSAASTVNGFTTDTLPCTTQFTPGALGEYIFDGAVTSGAVDAVPGNNSTAGHDTMNVVDYIYARDNGLIDGGFFPEVAYEGGNLFDINQDAQLTGVETAFGPSLGDGIEVFGKLYSIDANGEFIFEAETEYYTTDAANDAGAVKTLVFSNAVALTAGTTYLLTVGSFSTELSLSVAGESPDQTSFLYGDLGTAGVEWYFTNSTPVVRMDFDPVNSIESASTEANVSIYPNPASDESNVNFSLENASDVEITVTDLSGKAVFTSTLNNAAAGEHTVAIPTAGLSNGVYVVNYTAGNAVATEKLVVNK